MATRSSGTWEPVPQEAARLRISKSAVYDRVRAGTLEAKQRDGRLVVRLPDPPADSAHFEATIDIHAVAARLCLHPNTARSIAERGELPMLRRGREVRFRPEDVDAYIESRRIRPGDLAWNDGRPGWVRQLRRR